MYISIGVIAYNEEETISKLLEDIKNQDYDHSLMEIVLVDSASTDKTKTIMSDFFNANKDQEKMGFRNIQICDNPKKTLPCGWNVLLRAYNGEAILRVDAHAHIPSDFVSKNVRILMEGEDVCGGQRPNVIANPTPWKNTLLLAETSMFGSSIAPYRNNPGKTYVKSLFHGAYRREVFDKCGFYNEALSRTEDNEMHYRMRQAGFKLRFDPDIISYQDTRSSLSKMLKQKYANGYWIGKTSKVCRQCLSLYHFVPWAFVMAIMASTVGCTLCGILSNGTGFGAIKGFNIFANVVYSLTGLMWGAYWLLAVAMAVVAIVGAVKADKANGANGAKSNGDIANGAKCSGDKADKRNDSRLANITNIALPILFFLLHISYGIGTVIGLVAKKPI